MKFVYHHRTLANGAEGVHIRGVVDSLRNQGHTVHLCSLVSDTSGTDKQSKKRWSGIRHTSPAVVRELLEICFNLVGWIPLLLAIRKHKPDIVYKRHSRYDWSTVKMAKLMKVPLLLEVNTMYSASSILDFEPIVFRNLNRLVELSIYRNARHLLVISDQLKTLIARQGIDPEKIDVITSGVDTEKFDAKQQTAGCARSELDLTEKLVIGWSGYARDWHRVHWLIECTTELTNQCPEIRLLIISSGSDTEALKDLARKIGVEDLIRFVDNVPHTEMSHYLRAIDIGVSAGEKTYFATPIKLLEYMSMGIAVVAPDTINVRRIIDNGKDGLLFTDSDRGEMVRTILRLAGDPSLRVDLGERAREKMMFSYDWNKIAERIVDVCHDTTL